MNGIESALLGALEGFTEFLPISSTGHLILASHLFAIPSTDAFKSFEIAIQLGAILAVVVLYYSRFFDFNLLKKLFVAFLPTGILGLIFYHFIKEYLIGNGSVVAWALIVGGLTLIAFEAFRPKDQVDAPFTDISYRNAFIIGLCQSVAMIPGVSRSAATIVGGLSLGISRTAIVEFSFLLAVPTMLAATGYDTLKSIHLFSSADALYLAIGFAVSFMVAMLSMQTMLSLVKKYGFTPFGYYRIFLGLFFLIFVLS